MHRCLILLLVAVSGTMSAVAAPPGRPPVQNPPREYTARPGGGSTARLYKIQPLSKPTLSLRIGEKEARSGEGK